MMQWLFAFKYLISLRLIWQQQSAGRNKHLALRASGAIICCPARGIIEWNGLLNVDIVWIQTVSNADLIILHYLMCKFQVLCSSWVMWTLSLWVITLLWRLRMVWSPAFKHHKIMFWINLCLSLFTLIQPTLKSLSLVTEQESTASRPSTTVTLSTVPRNSGSESSPRLPNVNGSIYTFWSWIFVQCLFSFSVFSHRLRGIG